MSMIKVRDITIYYEIHGNGPLLTLVMGLGCSVKQWQWMIPLLAESFKVIALDNRGAGQTSKPDMEYTTALFAEDIAALLDGLGIEKTHLFGASLGGMIAQKFALLYPEKLNKLVLGGTMPNAHHLPPSPEDMERMQKSQLLSDEEGIEQMIELFLSKSFSLKRPDIVAKLKEVMIEEKKQQGEDAFLRQIGALITHDTLGELEMITAPTLIITGDRDPIAPVANARLLAEKIPSSKLVELKGVYHAFWVERYIQAYTIIKNFLLE